LRRAIVAIARDETTRRRLADGALLRARDYSWEAKAEAIDRVYDRVLQAACERDVAVSETVIETSANSSH
jgi:hypothetical protein